MLLTLPLIPTLTAAIVSPSSHALTLSLTSPFLAPRNVLDVVSHRRRSPLLPRFISLTVTSEAVKAIETSEIVLVARGIGGVGRRVVDAAALCLRRHCSTLSTSPLIPTLTTAIVHSSSPGLTLLLASHFVAAQNVLDVVSRRRRSSLLPRFILSANYKILPDIILRHILRMPVVAVLMDKV